MSVETIEPDTSATSIGNDETLNISKGQAVPDASKEIIGTSLLYQAHGYSEIPGLDRSYPNEKNNTDS